MFWYDYHMFLLLGLAWLGSCLFLSWVGLCSAIAYQRRRTKIFKSLIKLSYKGRTSLLSYRFHLLVARCSLLLVVDVVKKK